MEREEPIEHELIKDAATAEISATSVEVSPTSEAALPRETLTSTSKSTTRV
jgi:hypothetical protein